MTEQDVTKRIEDEIKSNKVVLFMMGTPEAPQCDFSELIVELLNGYKHPYKGIDVFANPDIRASLPKYSKWPTYPQLFINGQLVGGCEITHELSDSGELKSMLEKAFEGDRNKSEGDMKSVSGHWIGSDEGSISDFINEGGPVWPSE